MNKSTPSVETILLEAVEIASTADRQEFVDKACAGDAALRQQVEQLIANHFQAGSFLEQPVAHIDATGEYTPTRENIQGETAIAEAPGTIIGPYKLLEQIGEGGMGLVYVAEQQHPVKRRVALKIIKPGMDSRQVIARFEAERQALALMEHPNIAKVYDGGTTRTVASCQLPVVREESSHHLLTTDNLQLATAGRPYFVMELVKGIPITDYCDQHKLSTRQRLALFLDVCHAVQHAHQKGIIHRDIKPSNVLVSLHDVTPVVKVIDFGIAKATSGQLTDNTVYTAFAQMLGTPLYMSPEQAGLSDLDVDTRSDVYSLGVLLYELLTGTTPFDSETLKKAGYDEMRRIIREDEPPRPSARLSTMQRAHLSTIAAQRGLEPRRLSQHLRGELDWIVMRALEKDRDRRYESASAFAADVQRFLNDEPVQACPPSALYRLKKLARRHKAKVAAAAVLFAMAGALTGGIGWLIGDRAARRADAENNILEALGVAQTKLPLGNPHDPELITAARKAEAQLTTGVVGDAMRLQVDQILADLTMLDKLEQIRLDQARVTDGHFDIAGADAAYATAFRWYGIDVDALPIHDAASLIAERAIGIHLAVALDHWALARKEREKQTNTKEAPSWKRLLEVAQLADADYVRGSLREAMINKKSSAELKKLAASASVEKLPPSTLIMLADALSEAGALPLTIELLRQGQQRYPADFWIHHYLAFLLHNLKPPQLDEAIACYRIALALRPESPGVHLNLGNAFQDKRQFDKAIVCAREAMRLKEDYSSAYLQLGTVLDRQGKLDEAIAEYRKGLHVKPDDAELHNNLGVVLKQKGQLSEAVAEYREALRLNPNLSLAHNNLGITLEDKGDVAGATKEYREALRCNNDLPEAHFNLGQVLRKKKQFDKAIAEYRAVLRINNDFFRAHYQLGITLSNKGDVDGAIREYQEALRLDPDDPETHYNLGNAFRKKRKHSEAIKEFREALRLKKQYPDAHINLGNSLYDTDHREEALAEYRAAIQIDPKNVAAHNNLGAALQEMGRLDEAIPALQTALKLSPADANGHNNLGIVFARRGELEQAIVYFRAAVKLNPKLTQAHANLGHALALTGQTAEAIAALQQLLKRVPNHPLANNELAWLLATCPDEKFRNAAQAVELAKKATKAAPSNKDYWNTLGVAFYRAGKWSEAVAALEKAEGGLGQENATDWFFLAMTHWRLGHKEKAGAYFQKAAQWMEQHKLKDEESRRFRAEAARLLQIREAEPELLPPPREVP